MLSALGIWVHFTPITKISLRTTELRRHFLVRRGTFPVFDHSITLAASSLLEQSILFFIFVAKKDLSIHLFSLSRPKSTHGVSRRRRLFASHSQGFMISPASPGSTLPKEPSARTMCLENIKGRCCRCPINATWLLLTAAPLWNVVGCLNSTPDLSG